MVTDGQYASLRAWLTPGADRVELSDEDRANWEAHILLVANAFHLAATKRFGEAGLDEVIDYVADVRTRSAWLAENLDPVVAERLLLRVTPAQESFKDIDIEDRFGTWLSLLGEMVTTDRRLSGGELDEFLTRARAKSDEWLTTRSGMEA